MNKLLSVVVACYNEEEALPYFYNEINKISKKMKELDFTLYYKHKKPYSWKEQLLFYLLKNRFFCIYDSLLTVKG